MSQLFEANSSNDQEGNGNPPATQVVETKFFAGLEGLVGEGKKYATLEAALASVPHKEQHISRLETELAELRQRAAEAGAVSETYDAVQEMLKEIKATPKVSGAAALSEQDISVAIDRKLVERETQRVAQENLSKVKGTLVEQFGDKAESWYLSRSNELGVGPETIESLAARSPKAALELLGIKRTVGNVAPTKGSVSTEHMTQFQPRQEGIKSTMGGKARPVDLWREISKDIS